MKLKAILLIILILIPSLLTGCSESHEEVNALAFWELSEKVEEDVYDVSSKAKELDGKVVEIIGYMSPLTPLEAEYFYMIQVPGGSCPFCGGEDVDFLQVIQVFAPDGKTVDFSSKAMKVTGILEVGEDPHTFSIFRIKSHSIEEHKY
ncbi:MAG: hypothetical protein JJT76_07770 [Clostridiaceae bacterium]|nr:hypothetical protein [Clostridiaceae bacterium]